MAPPWDDEDETKENINPEIYFTSIGHRHATRLLLREQQPYPLTVRGCTAYFNVCKARLTGREFQRFLDLINSCNGPYFNVPYTLTEVCRLLQHHPDLIQGFGMFLTPDINIMMQSGVFLPDCDIKEEPFSEGEEDQSQEIGTTIKQEVFEDVEIKKEEVEEEFQEFKEEEVANGSTQSDNEMETSDQEETAEMEVNVKQEEETEAAEENEYEEGEEQDDEMEDPEAADVFLTKLQERFETQPEVTERFDELLLQLYEDDSYLPDAFLSDIAQLLCGHDDLIEEVKDFIPFEKFWSVKEETSDVDEDVKDEEYGASDNESINSEKSETSQILSRISFVDGMADVYKFGSYEEHKFFDDVKEAVGYKEVYNNFLRCLHMFNEDFITRSELMEQAVSYLGRHPELLRQLRDMLGFRENGNNVEKVPMKIIKLEDERKALEEEEEVDIDVGFSLGGRQGTTYRCLPKDFEQPLCSGRNQLCNEVLNDRWVSFPSWSEDSTFVTSCKTQYEEIIYRCEDERFELDMAITANQGTMQVLQDIQKKMNKMTFEERTVFHLDDSLNTGGSTVLHQRALHRMYGDKTQELVDGLKRNPWVAVPIILKRLKGKDEEWKEKQRKFNDTWRNQIDLYYLRSLDHRGINFKQNDGKSFRPRTILTDMEMLYAEKKANQHNQHFTAADHVLEFKQMEVFQDALELMLLYLKKLPGVVRDDRHKIEMVIRSFIPDFFTFPRCTVDEEEDEDLEEESSRDVEEPMEIKEEEERSGHTTPTGSTRGEEIPSDLESNSNETDHSEESEKSFVDEIDVFDKIDPLPPTLLSYTLFFADKTWYVFFRQFHILFERLSRLYSESARLNHEEALESEDYMENEENMGIEERPPRPTYRELVGRLGQLVSGMIDYNQFEEESRHLFGIIAFVSFTMDKLLLSIVRQLQHVVTNDTSKHVTALFLQNLKCVATEQMTSPREASYLEHQYLNKVEKVVEDEDERSFKVVWHKEVGTLTIEILEQESDEDQYDPIETERWSNYVDNFVNPADTCEEFLEENECAVPVILPRNLRKMKAYWAKKVTDVELSWHKRQDSEYHKKIVMNNKKRKALGLSLSLSKMARRSSKDEDILESLPSSRASSVNEQELEEQDVQEDNEEQEDSAHESGTEIQEEVSVQEDTSEFLEESEFKAAIEAVQAEVLAKIRREELEKIQEMVLEEVVESSQKEEPEGIQEEEQEDSQEEDMEESQEEEDSQEEPQVQVESQEEFEEGVEEEDKEKELEESERELEESQGELEEDEEGELEEGEREFEEGEEKDSEKEFVEDEEELEKRAGEELEDGEEGEFEEVEQEELDESEQEELKEDEDEKLKDSEEEEFVENEGDELVEGEGAELDEAEEEELEDSLEEELEKSQKEELEDNQEELVESQEDELEDSQEVKEIDQAKVTESSQVEGPEYAMDVDETAEGTSDMSHREEIFLEVASAEIFEEMSVVEEEVVQDIEADDDSKEQEEKPPKQIDNTKLEKEQEKDDSQANKSLEEEQEEMKEDGEKSENEEPKDPEEFQSPESEDRQESTADEGTPKLLRSLRSINRRKPFDYSIRTRKNRAANQAKKRRPMKRRIVRTVQSRKRRRTTKTTKSPEVIDDPEFDYNYFSEMSEEDKLNYLLFLNVDVQDNVQVSFTPGCYKMCFVQGCDYYLYRGRSFTRVREVHRSISETKTSNFNSWHRVWQERFVPPILSKSCNDWLLKSEPGKYMMWQYNVGDCMKPPYIPYYKYKKRFYKKK